MTFLRDAQQVLNATELSLRDLMERALAAQQYSDVAGIARIADAITQLRHHDGDRAPILAEGQPAAGSSASGQLRQAVAAAPSTSQKGRPKAQEYPRFERDGDRLVKIGWSKRDDRIYEHRAPREVVFIVSSAMSTRAKPKAPFSMDQILPISDGSGQEVPSYQAYLALAWLRSIGVVQRRGKEGYALTNGVLDAAQLQRLWNATPDRH